MTKKEASDILFACNKHGIGLTVRNEANHYLVTFYNRLEVKNFEAAKLITNALVIENRNKRKLPEKPKEEEPSKSFDFSRYSRRKREPDTSKTLAERHGVKE